MLVSASSPVARNPEQSPGLRAPLASPAILPGLRANTPRLPGDSLRSVPDWNRRVDKTAGKRRWSFRAFARRRDGKNSANCAWGAREKRRSDRNRAHDRSGKRERFLHAAHAPAPPIQVAATHDVPAIKRDAQFCPHFWVNSSSLKYGSGGAPPDHSSANSSRRE